MLTAATALVVMLIWVSGRSRIALASTLVMVLAGLVAAAAWVPEESLSRQFTVRREIETGSLGERGAIWRAGFKVFAENPILGIGVGSFQRGVVPDLGYRAAAHNTPLSVATETGVVGLVLLLAIPASLIWTTRRSSRDDRILVLALVLAWFVGTFSGTWEDTKQTWLVFLIGSALAARSAEKMASHQASSHPEGSLDAENAGRIESIRS
jgi:O-antigen ligase